MELFREITTIIFISSCIIGMVFWLFAVIETFASYKFKPIFFNFGLTVHREDFTLHGLSEKTEIGKIYKIQGGSYKFINETQCLFISCGGLFRRPALKGKALITRGLAKTESRIYLGLPLFFMAFLVGWTAGGITYISYNIIMGLLLTVGGWLFVFVINYLIIRWQINSTKSFIGVFKSIVTVKSPT